MDFGGRTFSGTIRPSPRPPRGPRGLRAHPGRAGPRDARPLAVAGLAKVLVTAGLFLPERRGAASGGAGQGRARGEGGHAEDQGHEGEGGAEGEEEVQIHVDQSQISRRISTAGKIKYISGHGNILMAFLQRLNAEGLMELRCCCCFRCCCCCC